MAPSIRYINQSAPFWDFIASFEDQAEQVSEHPFFARGGGEGGPAGPWGRRGGRFHGGPRHHGFPFAHRGRPGPPQSEAEAEASSPATARGDPEKTDDPVPDPQEDTPAQPPHEACGRKQRGHWGGHHHGHGHGWGPHGHHHGGRGGYGMHGRGGFGFLSELFNPQGAPDQQGDFKPEVDVFDTESVFVVHISLPGAHKEDIGVSWDAEKSELTISGVVHRPGDEDLLKTLALDERKVGAFERMVRLGTRANPAQIDVDGITAKLENGILLVEVPKLNADFVEIKKVDIE